MNELYCKWVSPNMTTRNNTHWKLNVPKELPEKKNLWLCSEGLFHYFLHPYFAVMFKEKYRCEDYSKLYEVLPERKIIKDGSLCGATKLTLIKQLEIPEVTLEQRISFGILCALEVYKEPRFVEWANNWLNGKDRSKESTASIVNSVYSAISTCEKGASYGAYAAYNGSYHALCLSYCSRCYIDCYGCYLHNKAMELH